MTSRNLMEDGQEMLSESGYGAGPAVTVKGLMKRYESRTGSIEAVRNLSFDIDQGDFVSLVGPSGCGKSTTLLIVAGLLEYEAGQVIVLGEPAGPGRKDVGVMFQSPVLLPWRTVLRNVLLPFEIYRESTKGPRTKALELLELVGLEGFAEKYPWELSGGMQQRVALARLLVTDPGIMLMDEPFASLDEFTRERLVFEVASLHEELGRSSLYVTHNIEEALILSDQVVVLSKHPGELLGVVEVDLPRPRTADLIGNPRFVDKINQVRGLLKGQM